MYQDTHTQPRTRSTKETSANRDRCVLPGSCKDVPNSFHDISIDHLAENDSLLSANMLNLMFFRDKRQVVSWREFREKSNAGVVTATRILLEIQSQVIEVSINDTISSDLCSIQFYWCYAASRLAPPPCAVDSALQHRVRAQPCTLRPSPLDWFAAVHSGRHRRIGALNPALRPQLRPQPAGKPIRLHHQWDSHYKTRPLPFILVTQHCDSTHRVSALLCWAFKSK